jgi:hypothetical protein
MKSKDNLKRNKNDGSYNLKSKTKKAKKGACKFCGHDPVLRDGLFRYITDDMMLVREYIEDHLTTHSNHKSMTPIWCEECHVLLEYKLRLDNELK